MKAVIYHNDTQEITGIITNVINYTDTSIYGDQTAEGFGDSSFLLLDDDTEITDIINLLPFDLKIQKDVVIKMIKEKTVSAVNIYNQASPLVQAMFFSALQWIQNQPIDENLLSKVFTVIQGIYVSDNDPQKLPAEALRSSLLKILAT